MSTTRVNDQFVEIMAIIGGQDVAVLTTQDSFAAYGPDTTTAHLQPFVKEL